MIKKTGSIKVGSGVPGVPTAPGIVRAELARAQVSFDVEKFDAVIQAHGYDVKWEKAMYCPNREGPAPYSHNIGCTACGNTNFVFFDEIETRMTVQSVKVDEQYYMYGRYTTGTVEITPMSGCRLNFWDKITLLNGTARFSELLLRQPEGSRDRPKYNPIGIEAVTYIDRSGAAQFAVVGTDVTYDAVTGEVVWLNSLFDPNKMYSISYLYRPEYIVMDMVREIREQPVRDPSTDGDVQTTFPMAAVAQLSFLIRDESADKDAQGQRQNPFPV